MGAQHMGKTRGIGGQIGILITRRSPSRPSQISAVWSP
jgi:hypothetical protein